MKSIAIFALTFSICFDVAGAFAQWMTNREFCRRSLAPGEIIMNAAVFMSNDRHIEVVRDGKALPCGSEYIPGEKLEIKLSEGAGEYVFENNGGSFTGGGCDGRRFSSKGSAFLEIPSSYKKSIELWAGWASGHEAVKMSEYCSLRPESSSTWSLRNKAASTVQESENEMENGKKEKENSESFGDVNQDERNKDIEIDEAQEKPQEEEEDAEEQQEHENLEEQEDDEEDKDDDYVPDEKAGKFINLRGVNHFLKHSLYTRDFVISFILAICLTLSCFYGLFLLYINRFKIQRYFLSVRGYDVNK